MSQKKKEKEYPCIWNPKINCPIRKLYKLKPESLAIFCEMCPYQPLNERKYPS